MNKQAHNPVSLYSDTNTDKLDKRIYKYKERQIKILNKKIIKLILYSIHKELQHYPMIDHIIIDRKKSEYILYYAKYIDKNGQVIHSETSISKSSKDVYHPDIKRMCNLLITYIDDTVFPIPHKITR